MGIVASAAWWELVFCGWVVGFRCIGCELGDGAGLVHGIKTGRVVGEQAAC